MVEQQQKLALSPYIDIYELVIPKDNLLRQIKELVDFGFIYEELIDKYCLNNGRNAVPPVRMFKYLLLKSIYDLSDIDVVERSKYDMSFKFFLGFLQLHLCGRNILPVKRFQSADDGRYQFLFYIHDSNVFSCVQR